MSGGKLNYLYSQIANALTGYKAPAGHYGIGNSEINHYYDSSIDDWRKINPMHDKELSGMMYDISCLLHSLEWLESYDIGDDRYKADVKAFKNKWYNRTGEDRHEAYKGDIRRMLKELSEEMGEC